MGMILGFLLGMGFCFFVSDMLAHKMLKILGAPTKKKKKREEEETFDADDPANHWKPPGWRPDRP